MERMEFVIVDMDDENTYGIISKPANDKVWRLLLTTPYGGVAKEVLEAYRLQEANRRLNITTEGETT